LNVSLPNANAASIAEQFGPVSTGAFAVGYGSHGKLRQSAGRILGYTRAGRGTLAQTMVISGGSSPGDSGGPIFNARGELLAVLWGSTDRETYGTCCLRARQFLDRALGKPQSANRLPSSALPDAPKFEPRLPASSADANCQARLEQLQRELAGAREETSRLAEQLQTPRPPGNQPSDATTTPGPAAGAITTLATRWLSGKVMALLVGLGVPGWAAMVIVWLLKRRAAKRLRTKPRSAPRVARQTHPALNDDYAGQLLSVFAQSGRSPTQDATLGREYDEELRRAEESSDAQLARWAKSLRSRVEGKFLRIHGPAPAPAEPVQT
jgi:hypothetical protein